MRLKEWYGYHFPELTKIVTDNLAYTKVVMKIGMKENCDDIDLTEEVGEEMDKEIKTTA